MDTGAEASVVPPLQADQRRRSDDNLTFQAVNNTPISTYGTQSLTLDVGLRRTFRWVFVIANVKHSWQSWVQTSCATTAYWLTCGTNAWPMVSRS